jgi:uncharacterized protein YjbI with pentapeptide repeats
MTASMPEQAEAKSERAANFSLGAAVLLFAYVGLAVLKQSDAELILPSSRFDLGGLLEKFKEGVPGGAFVTPLLQIEIPLKIFYTVGPVGLLILHAAIVLQPHLLTRAAVPLRIMAIWLPPLVLGLIRWRFAPFVSSRPQPPPPTAIALEAMQVIALAADIAVTAVAILWNRTLVSESPFPRIRRATLALRGWWQAAVLWLAAALVWPVWAVAADASGGIAWGRTPMLIAGAGIVILWVAGGSLPRRRKGISRRFFRRSVAKEDLDMRDRFLLAASFLGLALLPASGRAIDLSGEKLVAQEPTETMIAALIVSERPIRLFGSPAGDDAGARLVEANRMAWLNYGRGIDLSDWNFPRGQFDHATMADINLTRTDLRSATLDHANLIGAKLTGAKFAGASLRYVDLSWLKLRGDAGAIVKVADSNASIPASAAAQDACGAEPTVDLSNVDLTGANFESAELQGALLKGATLKDGSLKHAFLTCANFCGADLRGVDLSDADIGDDPKKFPDFRGADLAGATLPLKLEDARLTGANIYHIHIKDHTGPVRPDWKRLLGLKVRIIKPEDPRAKPEGVGAEEFCVDQNAGVSTKSK